MTSTASSIGSRKPLRRFPKLSAVHAQHPCTLALVRLGRVMSCRLHASCHSVNEPSPQFFEGSALVVTCCTRPVMDPPMQHTLIAMCDRRLKIFSDLTVTRSELEERAVLQSRPGTSAHVASIEQGVVSISRMVSIQIHLLL